MTEVEGPRHGSRMDEAHRIMRQARRTLGRPTYGVMMGVLDQYRVGLLTSYEVKREIGLLVRDHPDLARQLREFIA